MGDSYHPGRSGRGRNRQRPPTDPVAFHAGGGASYAAGDDARHSRDGRSAFHFSSDRQGPQFKAVNSVDRDERFARRNRGGGRDAARSADTHNGNGFRRGPFRKFDRPAERALLSTQYNGAEQNLGVSNGPSKFRSVDTVSEDATSDDESRSSHKIARVPSLSRSDGDTVPKWSNPDPYTVLPPPEDTTGKKRDVVQMIRKAKNEPSEKSEARNAVTANEDFISFDDPDIFQGSLNEAASTGPLHSTNASINRLAGAPALTHTRSGTTGTHKRKRVETEGALGDLIPSWQPTVQSVTTPWIPKNGYTTLFDEPVKWLHNEILDFFDYVRPLPHEDDVRKRLIQRVEKAVGNNCFGEPGHLICLGSFAAGLHLPTGDMDLAYVSDSHHYQHSRPVLSPSIKAKRRMGDRLKARRITDDITFINRAKVPIIKFTDKDTGLRVDMSFEILDGLATQETFMRWRKDYQDMVYLVFLVKQFLLMRDLSDVSIGGLGGFSIVCLVVSFLQHNPKYDNLGSCFLDFLDYYGNKFDLSRTRIVMNPPALVDKGRIGIDGREEKPDRLSIQDPNKAENNISGGSSQIRHIFKTFSNAHRALCNRMDAARVSSDPRFSILGAILAGDYSSYEKQRGLMRHLSHFT